MERLPDYLEEILLDPASMKVVQAGRRVGKTRLVVEDAVRSAEALETFTGLILTPYEDQRSLVQERLVARVGDKVRAHGTNWIDLKNGSRITTVTASRKPGCGTRLDKVWIEEPDSIADVEDRILALLASQTTPNAMITGCPRQWKEGEPPSFFRSKLARWMKRFYLPSWYGPEWTDEIEAWLRQRFSPDDFNSEFLAAC